MLISTILQHYSLQDVVIFIIFLALSVKGCISFFDWGYNTFMRAAKRVEETGKIKHHIESYEQEIDQIKTSIAQLSNKIDILVNSDKDAIKAFITRQHHYFCYDQGWIDDYSLDCIQRRYDHYRDEGGNSFIQDLMTEIKNLPKQPYLKGDQQTNGQSN